MNGQWDIRFRRLERRNRLAFLLMGIPALFFALGGAPEGSRTASIRTQRIELVDPRGEVRAVLGTDAEGANGLFIHDPEGIQRLALTHDPDPSALFIHDAAGTVRVGIARFAHGGGGVALHGAGSRGAAVPYHKEDGSLSFHDREGNITTRIPPKK